MKATDKKLKASAARYLRMIAMPEPEWLEGGRTRTRVYLQELIDEYGGPAVRAEIERQKEGNKQC